MPGRNEERSISFPEAGDGGRVERSGIQSLEVGLEEKCVGLVVRQQSQVL